MLPYCHMKTTIDMPDALFEEVKRLAARDRRTLRSVIMNALSRYVAEQRTPREKFTLADGSFGGEGIAAGIREGDWEQTREMIYEGRGG